MSANSTKKLELRLRRKARIRKKILGTAERPRLTVFRSARHLTAQVIDDLQGKTLVSIHSYDLKSRANKDACSALGKELAKKCLDTKINAVVFDKNGFSYHGRIQVFADSAREAGLAF
jgi:large subunit ribosomal protein L18